MNLSQLFERQPGLQLAFLPTLEVEPALESIAAFANTEGGQLVVGADAQGTVSGGVQIEDAEDIQLAALQRIHPPVQVEIEPYELPRGTVLVLNVSRSPDLHSLADGRVVARRGARMWRWSALI